MKRAERLVREWLKSGNDDCLDMLNHLSQQFVHDDSLYRGFLEHYAMNRFCVHLHFVLAGGHEGFREHFCARMEWSAARDGLKCGAVDRDGYVEVAKIVCRDIQCAVLIRVAQTSQRREHMIFDGVSGFPVVRLHTLDCCNRMEGDALKIFPADVITEDFVRVTNRKALLVQCRCAFMFHHNLANNMIQASPQVTQAIASDQGDGGIWLDQSTGDGDKARIFLDYSVDDASATFELCGDVSVECLEMCFGPSKLENITIGNVSGHTVEPLIMAQQKTLKGHAVLGGLVLTPRARKYLRLSTVARRLDVSVKTIRAWIAKGKIPAERLPNGYWRVREDDLENIPSRTTPDRAQPY